jgi:flagellar motility protein MotE (MotC chaperone)
MNAQSARSTGDRIVLSLAGRSQAALSPSQRRSSLWTIAGGVVGSTILLWIMVQLGQASNNPKDKLRPAAVPAQTAASHAVSPVLPADEQEPEFDESSRLLAPPTQGPALDVPREVIGMLDLRKRDLDRREEAVRQTEERLMMVRSEVEKILAKNEVLEKRIDSVRAKAEQQSPKERLAQAQKNQLAKMYEAMPSEDAAVRLERMPDQKAIEILRLVKTKSAAAILAQVKPEHAAKLSVQLLAHKP